MNNEQRRIQFLISRDGMQDAAIWCIRTAGLYRKALLSANHYAKNREYRKKFIHSYLELKRFYLEHKKSPIGEQGLKGRLHERHL